MKGLAAFMISASALLLVSQVVVVCRPENSIKILANYLVFLVCGFWCVGKWLTELTCIKGRRLRGRKTNTGCCCCIWFSSASCSVVLSGPWDTPWVLLLAVVALCIFLSGPFWPSVACGEYESSFLCPRSIALKAEHKKPLIIFSTRRD